MRRRRYNRRRSSSWGSKFSGWWTDFRFFWFTREKGAWIFAFCAVFVVSTAGLLMHKMITKYPDKRELTCLALNVYFEARGESLAGQHAVAEVTMNRVASGRYPDSVCKVVYDKKWDVIRKRYVSAFSWTELDSRPLPKGKAWNRAQKAAMDVYFGHKEPELKGAMLYHSIRIRPSWARGVKPVARIGRHVFYKTGRLAKSNKRRS